MRALHFSKEFVLNPSNTGAVAPSSWRLAKLMVDVAEVRDADVIVEFGPGTGAVTNRILQNKKEDADFFAIELNERFFAAVSRRYPDIAVYNDCATNTKRYLDDHGHTHCDSVVCGLPWALIEQDLQNRLIDTILDILRPGGKLVTFAYWHGLLLPSGSAFKGKLRNRFTHVGTTRTVWMNLPPAFVYTAVK